MKKISLLSLLLVVFFLSGCSAAVENSERHYRPGNGGGNHSGNGYKTGVMVKDIRVTAVNSSRTDFQVTAVVKNATGNDVRNLPVTAIYQRVHPTSSSGQKIKVVTKRINRLARGESVRVTFSGFTFENPSYLQEVIVNPIGATDIEKIAIKTPPQPR